MIRRPPRSTRTDTLFPYTTLFRSTYLQNGQKADISSPRRMMPGGCPIGSYVELSPPAEEMGVAEGIETALAVTRDFGIPCWSTISADGLKAFTPPAIVKRLRIFGDNDPKYGGQAAAYALAHRMSVRLDCVEWKRKRRVGKECVSTCRSRWLPNH